MIYRTPCKCLASEPEPQSSEAWATEEEYIQAHNEWEDQWAQEASNHIIHCLAQSRRGVNDSDTFLETP